MHTQKAPQHLSTSKKWVGKILKLVLALVLMANFKMLAQPWQQLGPGAGGQERAVYMYHNTTTSSYDLYVGSDVSGVWRANNFDIAAANPNPNYEYISNNRIFRYVNKFYNTALYPNDLFVLSRGGIDRIDLVNKTKPMVKVNFTGLTPDNMDKFWISDMYISPKAMGTNKYLVYFVTGNTRTNSDDKKPQILNAISDLYRGTFDLAANTIDITDEYNLSGLTANRNVYCVNVNDGASITSDADDVILCGTENGLYRFTNNFFNTAAIINPLTGTSPYQVTSITTIDHDNNSSTADVYLFTVYGDNVYSYDFAGTAGWVTHGTQYIGDAPAGSTTDIISLPHLKGFNQLHPLVSQTTGVITGWLLVNAENDVKFTIGTTNYKNNIGVFYCPISATNLLPNGNWIALDVNDPTNDFGWNTARPSGNINGSLLTDNGKLLIGKSGTIVISKAAVIDNVTTKWQQIYCTQISGSCTGQDLYKHSGYVNTATRTVFPDGSNHLYLGQLDRVMLVSPNSTPNNGSYFKEIIVEEATNTNPCEKIVVDAASCNGQPISDCVFFEKTNSDLYSGIARGFANNKSDGYIIKKDNTTQNWSMVGNSFCGDPKKILFANADRYAILNINVSGTTTPNYKAGLYFYNSASTTWTAITFSGIDASLDDIVDAVLIPNTTANQQHLFLIVKGATTRICYFKGSDVTWTSALAPFSFAASTVEPKILAAMPYSTYFKILCGTVPVNANNGNTCNFYELYNSTVLPTAWSINEINGNEACGQTDIFKKLNYDNVDNVDQGVTAININTTTHTIYVATVHHDDALTPPIKSHLYKGYYDSDGKINAEDCWIEMTANLPNKTITFLNTNDLDATSTTNTHFIYGCSRGLGAWKRELLTDCGKYTAILHQSDINTTTPISGSFNLNENLICNQNVTLNNVNLSITEGISITVPAGKTLTLQNCFFETCSKMWQGIINNGGTVIIDNSTIKDAITALFANTANSVFTITNCTFDQNDVSIDLSNQNFTASTFTGNTFEYTAPPKSIIYPNNNISNRHIALNNATHVTIGNANAAANNFKDANFGIYSNASELTVNHNNFTNLGNNDPAVNYFYGGITANTSGTLTVGTGSPNNFVNCNTGILTQGDVTVTANDNTFDKCANGIGINSNIAGSVDVINNTFTYCEYAIYCWEIGQGRPVRINSNNLTSGYDASGVPVSIAGIAFFMPYGNDLPVEITDNTITDYPYGIAALNMRGSADLNIHPTIANNTITYSINETHLGTANYYGILLQNCKNLITASNSVTWAAAPTDPSGYASRLQGIRAADCQNTIFNANTLTNNGIGIYLNNDAAGNILTCNVTDNTYPGFFLDNVANLPQQGNAGTSNLNHWLGDYTINQRQKIDGYSPTPIPINWYYSGAANILNSNYPKPSPPSLIFAIPTTSYSTFNCGIIPDRIDSTLQDDFIDEVIADSILLDSYTPSAQYAATEYAYRTMYDNYFIINDVARLVFYQQTALTNIGTFNEIYRLVKQGLYADALVLNNTITNGYSIDENRALVNEALINRLANHTNVISVIDSSLFENIANSNAAANGDGVYYARAYLRQLIVDHNVGYLRQQNILDTAFAKATGITVYPVPVNNSQDLVITSQNDAMLKISIYNTLGVCLKEYLLPEATQTKLISVSNFNPGYYNLVIKTAKGATLHSSFIKIN
jgi:hypothetical protein